VRTIRRTPNTSNQLRRALACAVGALNMGFLGVYKALYDYVPQGESELAINEGDILYVLEKSGEDGWWKAKKKASADDDDEPVGLIPNNYIEEVCTALRSSASLARAWPYYHQ
jgi:hypothetical protein